MARARRLFALKLRVSKGLRVYLYVYVYIDSDYVGAIQGYRAIRRLHMADIYIYKGSGVVGARKYHNY